MARVGPAPPLPEVRNITWEPAAENMKVSATLLKTWTNLHWGQEGCGPQSTGSRPGAP